MKNSTEILLEAAETMLRYVEAGHAGAGHALDCVYVGLRDAVNDMRGRHYGATVPPVGDNITRPPAFPDQTKIQPKPKHHIPDELIGGA